MTRQWHVGDQCYVDMSGDLLNSTASGKLYQLVTIHSIGPDGIYTVDFGDSGIMWEFLESELIEIGAS
ncbi:hypothetical protein BKG59_05495 [Mycobacteroides chelonae]|nr:hypothetical protein BKG63_24215 [Mycobacteroides chelonae]OHT99576.1 hypothetical protein BKG72_03885 [Mycobacteroides chelonae]OLT92891.1 hypothetical protein BKG59_05495 [Mycobacteroides chelonae]